MKKLTQLMLFCGLAILIPVSLHAEEQKQLPKVPENQVLKMPVLIDCGRLETIMAPIKKANEQPFLQSKTYLQVPNAGMIHAPSTTYMNPNTGTYTIVIDLPENDPKLKESGLEACIIYMGNEMRPAMPTGRAL